MRPALAAVIVLAASCGTTKQADGPQGTLRQYAAAIRADNPKATYKLLAEPVRKQMTEAEFVARWQQVKPELRAQASQLLARLERPAEITAQVTYPGGTRARLRYVDDAWRVDGGISVAFQTATPLDALKAFIRAVDQRSYEAVMKLLARSVRKSIEGDVDDRLAKLKAWLKKDSEVEVTGDRARVRYDPRYKIELVNEDGQWKVLDFD